MKTFRLAILASGGGTTAEAIVAAHHAGRLLGIVPACLIASRPDAGVMQKMERLGIPRKNIFVIEPKKFSNEEEFGGAILKVLKEQAVDLVGQYGWMIKTPRNVIAAFRNAMINQHPGPLDPGRPDFGGKGMFGLRVHAARLLFVRSMGRDFWTEATAQRVAEQFDEGTVLKRTQLAILPDDDPKSLAARLLPFEHETQIATLEDFMNGRVRELVRETPLVRKGEEVTLEDSKKAAMLLFPQG
ncbi:MAG: formyltransferase family protein [Minisyncoccia bacterium]|jgi:phosphoribosylglycinamide formyltransferase-1